MGVEPAKIHSLTSQLIVYRTVYNEDDNTALLMNLVVSQLFITMSPLVYAHLSTRGECFETARLKGVLSSHPWFITLTSHKKMIRISFMPLETFLFHSYIIIYNVPEQEIITCFVHL